MPDNTSEIITIAKIESKMFDNGGSQYKITTTGNKKFKFNDKLKAGGETVAYKQFKDMEIKVGSTVDVWYKSVEKDYQGTPYTDNMIASFKEAAGRPVTQNSGPQAPIQAKNEYIPTEVKDDKFWDKKAYKQCLWNYWLEKSVNTPALLTEEQMYDVWQVFNQIEQDADKRFATGWAKAEAIFGDEAPLPEERPF